MIHNSTNSSFSKVRRSHLPPPPSPLPLPPTTLSTVATTTRGASSLWMYRASNSSNKPKQVHYRSWNENDNQGLHPIHDDEFLRRKRLKIHPTTTKYSEDVHIQHNEHNYCYSHTSSTMPHISHRVLPCLPTNDFSQSEPTLLYLCRSHLWSDSIHRCWTDPQEAMPRVIGGHRGYPLYADTALGLACRAFNGTNSASEQHITIQMNVITTLYTAWPQQVRCGQYLYGRTPLHDAICNPKTTTELVNFLIDADIDLGITKQMSLFRMDDNGMYPMDHLISIVGRDEARSNNVMDSIRHLARFFPLLFSIHRPNSQTFATDDINDLFSLSSSFTSPIVRLLSRRILQQPSYNDDDNDNHSLSFKTLRPTKNSNRLNDQSKKKKEQIKQCISILLSVDSSCIKDRAKTTGCTPLHIALRNFGHCDDLIHLLLRADPSGDNLRTRNRFGDLPIHVAASMGVPIRTLRLVLSFSLRTTMTPHNPSASSSSLNCHELIHHMPHEYIWAIDGCGYTPLHLAWMRRVEGKDSHPASWKSRCGTIHGGGGGGGDMSVYRSGSPLRPPQAGLYQSMLAGAYKQMQTMSAADKRIRVEQRMKQQQQRQRVDVARIVLGSFWDNAMLILEAAHFGTLLTNDNDKDDDYDNEKNEGSRLQVNQFRLVHALASLTRSVGDSIPPHHVPLDLMKIAIWINSEQIQEQDEWGRTPLHYVAAAGSSSKSTSTTTSEKVNGPCGIIPPGWTELSSDHNHNHHQQRWMTSHNTQPPAQHIHNNNPQEPTSKQSLIDILLHPKAASMTDNTGMLPLHYAIESEKAWLSYQLNNQQQHHHDDNDDCIQNKQVINWTHEVQKIASAYPEALDRYDPIHGLYPFMQAAAKTTTTTTTTSSSSSSSSSITTIYELLRRSPSRVSTGLM